MTSGGQALEDYASAAARHWDNAQFLGNAGRWQEAAYLSGYIAECSLKTLLEHTAPSIVRRRLGHNLIALTGEALEMATLLNPASRRYPIHPLFPDEPGASQWSEEHRYKRTGFLPDAELEQIVAESQRIGRAVLIELVLDGIVEDVPL